ncbi:hydrolase [Edwardsiella anguillarum]|uniref:hydrolase n=1 Tax=Edwardsiella TaxID=635 RepID=UPI00045D1CBF|nr:hydrolase [Edwardsiella anguillarum]AKM46606.1 hydrolase [Edwardsiella sp. EA181011]GAJ67626.1 hydrolase, alpha/beta fold family [Edwardsiella piscicida]RFT05079.1 hydrolase [Edwardsiella anguillarum]WHP80117.1 hydrolase [Edwardsiella anguillarum]WHQ17576.1 hydrolase [Edwardsiella anguillarum]
MSVSTFSPPRALRNPHLQTILPRLLRRRALLTPVWQRLTLPDGDFIDLAWSEAPQPARHKPRVVLFHGLEGSVHSPYAHGLLHACREAGWLAVVMHFRGCSGEPNLTPRFYHSGETGDARFFLAWLRRTFGQVPTAAVGFSLGGNMLGCYLAEEQAQAPLEAAVMVSAPLVLSACATHLEHGVARIYQRYLLHELKQSARRKLRRYPEMLDLDPLQLRRMRRLREFDDQITARLHGFRDADDYYRRCSALPRLPTIRQPLLIIQARDDPFMTSAVIPPPGSLPSNIEYQLTAFGGHVGFIGGTLRHPLPWLEQRIPAWLAPYLE